MGEVLGTTRDADRVLISAHLPPARVSLGVRWIYTHESDISPRVESSSIWNLCLFYQVHEPRLQTPGKHMANYKDHCIQRCPSYGFQHCYSLSEIPPSQDTTYQAEVIFTTVNFV